MSLNIIILLWGISQTSTLTRSSSVEQDGGLVSADAGDNVTLRCFYQDSIEMHFSWYQQRLGHKPQLLSSFYRHDQTTMMLNQFEHDSRFSVQHDKWKNHLNISNVQLSDTAAYYCGCVRANVVEFGEGVFLSVKESNIKAIAHQPGSESVQTGDSVTLKRPAHTETCDGEHTTSVYWVSRGSGAGVVHARDARCEEILEGGSPTQSCVYHLQKGNAGPSDAGTHYRAVASCGEILFGNEDKPNVEEDGVEDFAAHVGTLVFLSVARTGVVLAFLTICTLFCVVKKWPAHPRK